MALTQAMIESERQHLSNAIDALTRACEELAAIPTEDAADAEVVRAWRTEISEISTMLDQAYGETFILEAEA